VDTKPGGRRRIDLDIDAGDWNYIKEHHIKYGQIFQKGLENIKNPGCFDRIIDQNDALFGLSALELSRRIAFLNGKLLEKSDILAQKEVEIQTLRNKLAVLEGVLGNSDTLFRPGSWEKLTKAEGNQ